MAVLRAALAVGVFEKQMNSRNSGRTSLPERQPAVNTYRWMIPSPEEDAKMIPHFVLNPEILCLIQFVEVFAGTAGTQSVTSVKPQLHTVQAWTLHPPASVSAPSSPQQHPWGFSFICPK